MKSYSLVLLALTLCINVFSQKSEYNSDNDEFEYSFEFKETSKNSIDSVFNIYYTIEKKSIKNNEKIIVKKNNKKLDEIAINKSSAKALKQNNNKYYFLVGQTGDDLSQIEVIKVDTEGKEVKFKHKNSLK